MSDLPEDKMSITQKDIWVLLSLFAFAGFLVGVFTAGCLAIIVISH